MTRAGIALSRRVVVRPKGQVPKRHDGLTGGIDRNLVLLALDEAIARRQDAAVGIGEVLPRDPRGSPSSPRK